MEKHTTVLFCEASSSTACNIKRMEFVIEGYGYRNADASGGDVCLSFDFLRCVNRNSLMTDA